MGRKEEKPGYRALLKDAYLRIRSLSAELEALEREKRESIAVIGMACRFPGGADTPEKFWKLLHDGVDTVAEIPDSRWDVDAYYHPDPEMPGRMYTRYGSFLENVDGFDAQFFGISPREVIGIDPQQRLLLEVGWEALENAGQAPGQLSGTKTGVFVGLHMADYSLTLYRSDPDKIDAYKSMGAMRSLAAGRLSYLLNLQGPAMQLDTACSSALLAVHLACRSLQARECHLALTGGVNLVFSPENSIGLSKMKALSADGKCKAFDASADGYGRGEGCGVVVLKRYSDALSTGDNILALITGSAVNHNGRSNGVTAPNGAAQENVIREALEMARASMDQVQYVETQGTGTAVGDPIEMRALQAVLGEERQEPLWIGSVKTNLGHLEAAAGIAGLIKVVLSLQHGQIPPHLHFKEPNPYIPWDRIPVEIPSRPREWPSPVGGRKAGVNAFGMSGTNVHVVVTEAPKTETAVPVPLERPLHILSLSAKSGAALNSLARSYEVFLADHPGASLADICFTANTGRSHFSHRLTAAAGSAQHLREQLGRFAAEKQAQELVCGRGGTQPGKIAFLFSGNCSKLIDMGRVLYESQPLFRQTLDHCDDVLRSCSEIPLIEILYPGNRGAKGDDSKLNRPAFAQPALFALEYALAGLWQSWGVKPGAVMGYGAGECAAACVAGVFSLEDGLKLTAARGHFMETAGAENDMCTVPVVPVPGELERAASKVAYSMPQIPFYSGFTGQPAADEIAAPAYWCRHVRQPISFSAGMKILKKQGCEIFMEIGPKPGLSGIGRLLLHEDGGSRMVDFRGGQEDWRQILRALGELYVSGIAVDWSGFDTGYSRHRIALPTYPFQRERYWIEEGVPAGSAPAEQGVHEQNRRLQPEHPARLRIISSGKPKELLPDYLREQVARVSGLPVKQTDWRHPLPAMGIDSLMALELRNLLKHQLRITIPAATFLDNVTIEDLTELAAEQLQKTQVTGRKTTNPGPEEKLPDTTAEGQENRTLDGISLPDIIPISRKRDIPLSFAQKRCWDNQRANPGSTFYNIAFWVQLNGKLETAVLEQSFNEMIRRHENLRTTFRVKSGMPVQTIAANTLIPIPVIDLRNVSEKKQSDEIVKRIREESKRPFDLVHGPLIRITLLWLRDQSHVLGICIHHLIIDVESLKIFLEELSIIYEAFAAGKPCPLAVPVVQYADFAYWQHRYFLPTVLHGRLNYWKQWLAKEPRELVLPYDRPRPPVDTFLSSSKKHRFSPGLTLALKKLGQRAGASLLMTLAAAFAALLYGYNRCEDMVVAFPMFRRDYQPLKSLIGLFATPVLLRVDIGGNPTFLELLGRVRQLSFSAISEQDVPLEQVLETSREELNHPSHPSYRVLLNKLEYNPGSYLKLPGLTVTPFPGMPGLIRQDLSLQVWEEKNRSGISLQGLWRYKKDLFDAETIAGMANHFQELLETYTANPGQPVYAPINFGAGRRGD